MTLLAAAGLVRAGGDADGKADLARQAKWPSGPGLAAAGVWDAGLRTHPEVIFADDFETGAAGETWDETNNKEGKVLTFADPGKDAGLGKRSLRVAARLGHNHGGGLTKWFEPADPVFIRFYTRFDASCDYVHHFVTLRANKSLRGADKWSGFGGAGLKPEGSVRFSTALEPWGNHGAWHPPGRWNFYSYWHEMDPSGDGKFWGNSFGVPSAPVIPRGKWIGVEFMLKHNTPGKRDGEQAFWIDGILQGHWQGINWRSDARLKANALTLESYVTERWTKRDENVVWFDNVVIARQYVGPLRQE